METAAEIKVLARGEPVPLDLLVRSNLVQQELTRLGINSIALLNRTVNVALDVMGKLRDLLDREFDRHDREWMDTRQRLTATEKTEKRPVIIRGRDVGRECRSIVNQLVTSMPKDVLLRTSFPERGKSIPGQITEEVKVKSKSSFARKANFTDAKTEYEPGSDCFSGDETMSGESDIFRPVQDDLSGARLMRPPRDRILSGESRNITDRVKRDGMESLLLLLLAHAGRVGLFCLQVKELSNLYRPKPQVCWGEWGGVLGAVEKVTCCVGGKGTGWAKVGDGAVEAG